MNKLKLYAICSFPLILSSCALKITQCVIDYPTHNAHCTDLEKNKDFDKPLVEMTKYECLSNDDYMELLRGHPSDLTLCAVVDAPKGDVHCSSPSGSFDTTLEAIHKYTCFTADDLATLARAIAKKKAHGG